MSRHTLYLARHGETDWNRERRWQGHTDIALNEAGRRQARELAEALRDRRLGRAFSSDLSRARETAEIVAAALGLAEVIVDADLRERSFGVFEGLTEAECCERYPEHWAAYRSDLKQPPPGAEAFEDVAQRMRTALERALHRAGSAAPQSILVVSHGGAMRALLLALLGTVPAPLGNGATYRLEWAEGTFHSIERLR